MDKYYRVFAEINLDALAHNIKEIRKIIQPKTELMAVIKADGYGHGAVPISKTLIEAGVDRFGVAVIEEGIALRKNGITAPILIFGHTPNCRFSDLVAYDLTQTVFKFDMAKKISEEAVKLNKIAKIHIKIDTGMHRLGFFPDEEALETIIKINELPHLMVEGIFTHFAKADELDKTYTKMQIQRFNMFQSQLREKGINIPIAHASNSAGLIEMKEANYQLVRAGIALYGLYPSEEVEKTRLDLVPALSLKSHVVFIKSVKAGEAISYGGIYRTSRQSIIATVPVGYADGYPRGLSSKGRVLIRGMYAPIVGRICMDQFMVDVSHIPYVKEGDEVVLIGRQGNNEITANEIADIVETIHYEIVCGLGKRIPRTYVKKGERVHAVDYFDIY